MVPRCNSMMQLMAAPLLGALACAALAGDATVTCTTPLNTVAGAAVVKITASVNGQDQTWTFGAIIDPGMTAKQKADRIADTIAANAVPKFTVEKHATDPKFTIKDLPAGATVTFHSHTTGEIRDEMTIAAAQVGNIQHTGFFDPFGYDGQPAIFTAGIVTDVGELDVQISAAELNFQTEGPIICQALFQRLAPHAPQYGAQINYAGDRLEIHFDPAYTVTPGGIIFGTNSPGEGSSGMIQVPETPGAPDCNGNGVLDAWDIATGVSQDLNGDGVPDECLSPCNPCDTNCDGTVNGQDISGFIDALSGAPGSCSPCNGDADGNGTVNGQDIDDFIACLAP